MIINDQYVGGMKEKINSNKSLILCLLTRTNANYIGSSFGKKRHLNIKVNIT